MQVTKPAFIYLFIQHLLSALAIHKQTCSNALSVMHNVRIVVFDFRCKYQMPSQMPVRKHLKQNGFVDHHVKFYVRIYHISI